MCVCVCFFFFSSTPTDLCVLGGTITVSGNHGVKPADLPMEYLLAHFGTKVSRVQHNFPLINNVVVAGVVVAVCSCVFIFIFISLTMY